ncbi:TetR family transcriptional regulator [Rhodococcus triatomae]|uniref:DNA-binding transcriptional regulator YbjK n=1 Tax=Rhodococcus triatomae TaxID=300028 RepID=A0A1G8RL14_9NOCA|nr:TetR family transcriptional regulator [Rhodococcus triatomae]QNG19916.1 TetR family transcriptional regulator [Rhodococcus triatomae]QNG24169.1 TetR family transcriptional regulator [Rhodococcus triatomae]SDJ17641.1 DNA-binding transcriptional regulator YbjK [Rhodococcus triatomae]
MVRNDERRVLLADAGLSVLAEQGARGLTHRAVDRVAGVPVGTTSNYFRTRDALIGGLVERIGERLTPDEDVLAGLAGKEPSRALFADYLRDIVRRLTENREVTLALFELRLESTRRPEVARVLSEWQRAAFEADVAFNTAAGLPGGSREIALFHYAVDGLLLDRLTTPLTPGTSTDEIVDALVAGLLPS